MIAGHYFTLEQVKHEICGTSHMGTQCINRRL